MAAFLFLTYTTLYDKILSRLEKYALKREYGFYEKKWGPEVKKVDKYEYRIKAEQIRKLAEQEDFASAVKIADTIDWNRVRSIPMLCLVGEIYEKNNMLEESRDVMLIAYDRHPYGRMIIYSLAELSIRLEDYIDAVEYYKEFVQVAPRDTGRYILQYKLYEAQHVGIQERIAVLEEFKKHEYIEKWAFELAYLYHRAGMKEKCIAECDEMIIWFSEGKYVEKAMELKMLYEPLSDEQQKKYENRNDVEIEKSIADVEAVIEKDVKEEEIQIKPLNYGIYDTVNLQNELARSMEKILNVTEQEGVSQAQPTLHEQVEIAEESKEDGAEENNLRDTALIQEAALLLSKITGVTDKNSEDDKTKIIPSKEIMDAIAAVHEEFNQEQEESQEETEQITSAVSEKDILTKQLTSQLSIEEVLQEWEKIKKETENKDEIAETVSFEEEEGTDLEIEGDLETETHELLLESEQIDLEEIEDDEITEEDGYYDDDVVKALEVIKSESESQKKDAVEDDDKDILAALKSISNKEEEENPVAIESTITEASLEDREIVEDEIEELEFESEDDTEEMFAALDQMLEPADIFYNEEDREKIEEQRRIREEELLKAESEEIDEELYENLRGVTGANRYGNRQEESLSDEIYAALKELKEGKNEVEDTEIQEEVEDTEIQEAVEATEIQEEVEDTEIQEEVEDTEIQEEVEDTEIQEEVEATEIQEEVEDTEIQEEVEDTEIQEEVEATEIQEEVEDTEIQEEVEATEIQEEVEDTEIQEEVEDTEIQEEVEATEIQEEVEATEIQEEVEDTEIQEEVEATEIQEEVEDTEIQEEVEDTEIQEEVEDTEIQEEVEGTEIQEEVEDTEIQEEVEATEIQEEVEATEIQEEVEATEIQEEVEATEIQEEVEATEIQEEVEATEIQEEVEATEIQEEIDAALNQLQKYDQVADEPEENNLSDEIYAALNQLQSENRSVENKEEVEEPDDSYERELYGDDEEQTSVESEYVEDGFGEETEENLENNNSDDDMEKFEDLEDAIMREAQVALQSMTKEASEGSNHEETEDDGIEKIDENQYWSEGYTEASKLDGFTVKKKANLFPIEEETEFEEVRMEGEQNQESEYETVAPDELEEYQEQEESYWSLGLDSETKEEKNQGLQGAWEEETEELQDDEVEETEELQNDEEEETEEFQDDEVEETEELQNDEEEETEEFQDDEVEETEEFQDDEVEEAEEFQDDEVEETEELQDDEVEEAEEFQDDEVEETEELQDDEVIEDAVGEIESEIQKSLPSGIGDMVDGDKEESEPFVLEEDAESFKKLFKYFTEIDGVSEQILDAIDKMEEISDKGNVIIMGDSATGKTTLAVDIIKAAKRSKNITGNKVARITGEAMNSKPMQEVIANSVGGVLIVEEAASMTAETVRKFSDALEKTEEKLLVILEDSRERMMLLLEMDNRFREKFPAVIDLPPYTNTDLVAFAHSYASEIGATIDEMGVLALYSKLAEMQYQSEVIPTLYHVKELVDGAMEKAKKRKKSKGSLGGFFSRKKEKTNETVIQEKDFM